MLKFLLAPRWRASQEKFCGFGKRVKKIFVNRKTWLLATAVLKFIYWAVRLIRQEM